MTLQIKSINSLEVKELMLAILLSTLIHESVQAQSVFSITRPSIQTPIPPFLAEINIECLASLGIYFMRY